MYVFKRKCLNSVSVLEDLYSQCPLSYLLEFLFPCKTSYRAQNNIFAKTNIHPQHHFKPEGGSWLVIPLIISLVLLPSPTYGTSLCAHTSPSEGSKPQAHITAGLSAYITLPQLLLSAMTCHHSETMITRLRTCNLYYNLLNKTLSTWFYLLMMQFKNIH